MTLYPDDQSWFWTEEWQAGEREVDEQIARGEVTTFDSTEEFLTHLKQLDQEAVTEEHGFRQVKDLC